ncbi:MAG: hypothetical protein H6581_20525 [Bacteroidia bacterium]|nr:hypothetical protein [Bacteroidia bacterium]
MKVREIYDLVNALSFEEKRKLNLLLSQNPSAHLSLFQLIQGGASFDLEVLAQKSGLTRKLLHKAFIRLGSSILETPVLFEEGTVPGVLVVAQRLTSLGLYKLALEQIEKGLKMALLKDRFELAFDLLELQKIICPNQKDEINKQKDEICLAKDELVRLQLLKSNAFELNRERVRGKDVSLPFAAVKKNALLHQASFKSISARIISLKVKYRLALWESDDVRVVEFVNQMIPLLIKMDDPVMEMDLVTATTSKAISILRLGWFEQADAALAQIILKPVSSAPAQKMQLNLYLSTALAYAGDYGLEKVATPAFRILEERKDEIEGESYYPMICFLAAKAAWALGKPEVAMRYLIPLTPASCKSFNQDIYGMSRLLRLLFMLDLQDLDLHNDIQSASRYFSRKGNQSVAIKTFLQMVGEIIRTEYSARPIILRKYLPQFTSLKKIKPEFLFFDTVEIEPWIESKLSGKRINNILLEKWKESKREAPNGRISSF